MSQEIIYLLGGGGAVWEMTLPLHPVIAKRYEAGEMRRVNPDGSPWTGDEQPRKPRSRPKAATADDGAG